MPGPHRVFVYGSLLRGLHNHHHLKTATLVKEAARTTSAAYVMVDSGHGYPFALVDAKARAGDARSALAAAAARARCDRSEPPRPGWRQSCRASGGTTAVFWRETRRACRILS